MGKNEDLRAVGSKLGVLDLWAPCCFAAVPGVRWRYFCFLTHTLWNSRIDEIRPLILWGLAGGDFEGF